MKGFTERNPLIIGGITIAFILAATLGALMLNSGLFAGRYEVVARFSDTAGLKPGDKVRVAGVPSGEVSSIRETDGEVEAVLKVDNGTELSRDTRAQIKVETVLGTKHVSLITGDDWSEMLEDGAVITDTRTPTELLDLQNISQPLLEESDGAALNQLLDSLTAVTEGKREDVATILQGLNDLTSEINTRETEARNLLDAAQTFTGTLAERDQELLTAVDNLNVVVGGLADRRVELARLLEATNLAANNVADLVADNRPQLDIVLDELHADLQIIDQHQMDLAHSVAYLSVAIEGFASIGYSGPEEFPNEWGNIFTQLLGPTSPDALFGSCGLVDDALDLAMGPDPLPCEERTGPLPGQAGASSAGEGSAGGSGSGGSAEAGSEDGSSDPASQLASSLDTFLAPVLAGPPS